MVTSYALIVPLRQGETARQLAASLGIARSDLKLGRRDGKLLIPISRNIAPPTPEASVELAEFDEAAAPGSYKDRMADLGPLREKLPSSFDIVGDLVVIKIPDELTAHGKAIGKAILEAHPNVRGVFHDEGVGGEHRLRSLHHLAGEDRTRTVHSEFGAKFHVDLAVAYFSPRLANEHQRVAKAVQPGETFVDATAGVGPFSILAALRKVQARFIAIDLNESALGLLRENLRLNRLEGRIEVVSGDARGVVPSLDAFHRVAVNLPHGGYPILEAAWARLREGGVAHYYAIEKETDLADLGERVLRRLEEGTGVGGSASEPRTVHAYSPKDRMVALDLKKG